MRTINDRPWSLQAIREAYGASEATICGIARRFVENGVEGAINRKKQQNRHHKITGEVEAHMIAICLLRYSGRTRYRPLLSQSNYIQDFKKEQHTTHHSHIQNGA